MRMNLVCVVLGLALVSCDGQGVEGSVGVVTSTTTVGVSGKKSAAELGMVQWNDLEGQVTSWNTVLKNPGPWAEKYDTTPAKVAEFAAAQLERVWARKDTLLPPPPERVPGGAGSGSGGSGSGGSGSGGSGEPPSATASGWGA